MILKLRDKCVRKLFLYSFALIALLLSFTLPEIGDYTIRELICGVQDTITVVRGTRIACEIIAVSNPGYVVYTIYDINDIISIILCEILEQPYIPPCHIIMKIHHVTMSGHIP